MPVRYVGVEGGAPPEVVMTPLIVFQNHRGRSIFHGRLNAVDRLGLFIRTARRVPLSGEERTLEDVDVWRNGRTTITARIKVTPLTGSRAKSHNDDTYTRRAVSAVRSEFRKFQPESRVECRSADRTFYMDIYPFAEGEGALFLSLSLFSPFNCVQPIFNLSEPLTGTMEADSALFAQAGRRLERELLDRIESPENGDGFDPVPDSTPELTWSAMGLDLPAAPADSAGHVDDSIEVPRKWTLPPPAAGEGPRVLFHFQAPLDNNAGEIGGVLGELEFEDGAIGRAHGLLLAAMRTITMGDQNLDRELRDQMLKTVRNPEARFDLDTMESPDSNLAFGRAARITARGRLKLRGAVIPMTVAGTLEPFLGPGDLPQLHVSVTGSFRLKEALDLEGPAGAWPAADTVILVMDFVMRAKE